MTSGWSELLHSQEHGSPLNARQNTLYSAPRVRHQPEAQALASACPLGLVSGLGAREERVGQAAEPSGAPGGEQALAPSSVLTIILSLLLLKQPVEDLSV